MLFEPGPIPQLAPDPSSLAGNPTQFADLAAAELAGLPDLESGLDDALGLLDAFDVPAEFDDTDLALSTVDAGLFDISQIYTDGHITSAQDAVDLATGQFNLATAESPAEIWEPVPAPLFGPAGGGPQPGTNGPTTIEIHNLTAPADSNFYSGDQFEVDIQVSGGGGNYDYANKAIKLTRSLDGVTEAELDIGGTDNFGRLVFRSSFSNSDIGSLVLGVDPSGYGTFPTVTVTVLAGPRPSAGGGGPAQPIAATIVNLGSGDPALFHILDVWRITITGPAGQQVYLAQVKNGLDQGEYFIGATDATGTLVIAGTMQAAQVGDYVETFRIGNVAVPNSLTFSVVP